jgi:AbrB family looped-hinge helix DNA binding protein
METTRLSTKGQVILPKSIRDKHQWRPGTEFILEDTPRGVLLRPVSALPPTRLKDVIGCLRYDGPPKTIEEMDEAIGKMIKERHARGRY